MKINDLTGAVIGAAIEVHKELGPGLLESTYEECLCTELKARNIYYPFKYPVACGGDKSSGILPLLWN